MYRLTITQANTDLPYIVYDCDTLKECTQALEQYKRTHDLSLFTNYDIIKVDKFLVDSYELDNLDFSDMEEWHEDFK